MSGRSKQIDAYISKAQVFAKPILQHLRDVVHKACPAAEEKMKWGFPHFDYKGKMMCSMAAFKNHCAFGFWKASLIDERLVAEAKTESAMGHLGKITSVKDLPSEKQLITWIMKAVKLNDEGIVIAKKPVEKIKKVLVVPKELASALEKNRKAKDVFENFPYSHKKEYIEWITEAKTEATRNRRIATTLEWVAKGKDRNWKYRK
ncbi:MAG: YdeI/OmpD-associated family protein [Chitinophagales bacterium]